MTVTYETYIAEKQAFIKKHGKKEWKVETSSMNEYGVYYKVYTFSDDAVWYERMSPAYETKEIEFEVKGITFKQSIEVKLFETEYFNSDNATSRKYYEKY